MLTIIIVAGLFLLISFYLGKDEPKMAHKKIQFDEYKKKRKELHDIPIETILFTKRDATNRNNYKYVHDDYIDSYEEDVYDNQDYNDDEDFALNELEEDIYRRDDDNDFHDEVRHNM